MKGWPRIVVAMLVVTVLAGAAGGWFGVRYGLRQSHSSTNLDQLLHHEIRLSGQQQLQIEALEADFSQRRKILEGRMRAANSELAAAIRTQHGYGPDAQRAIEHFHQAMGALQEETVRHVFEMRKVLTPAQVQQFDLAVSRALEPDQA